MIITTISLRNTGELTDWIGAEFWLLLGGVEVYDTGWIGSIQLDTGQEYTFNIPSIEADVAVCRVYDIDYPNIQVIVNGIRMFDLPINNDVILPEYPSQTECEIAGHYWYWDQCHETGEPYAEYNIPLVAPPPECTIDNDCVSLYGPDYVCIDGVCVYQEPPPTPDGGLIEWWNGLESLQKGLVLVTGVGAAGAIYLMVKKK